MRLATTMAFLCLCVTTVFSQEFSGAFSILPKPDDGKGEIKGIEKLGTDVFVTGNWQGHYDIDPRGSSQIVEGDDQGIFLARYDDDGKLVWRVLIDGTDMDQVEDLAFLESTSPDGGLYIVGHYESSTLTFPSSATSTTGTQITNQGNSDVFFAKYDFDGDLQWVYGFGSTADDYCTTVDVNDYSENSTDMIKVAIGGYLYPSTGGMNLNPGGTRRVFSEGGKDAWLAVYEDNGNNITFEARGDMGNDGVANPGTESSHEMIEALALDYPKVYSSMTFEYNEEYEFNAQTQQGTGCTNSPCPCNGVVTAKFRYGYTTSSPTGTRGQIIKHRVRDCANLETKWIKDPVNADAGLTTTESRYYDIKMSRTTPSGCNHILFGGYQLTDYDNDTDREPQYGGFLPQGFLWFMEELETVNPNSTGGAIHSLDGNNACPGPHKTILAGNSFDDLTIDGVTTSLDDGEAFVFSIEAYKDNNGLWVFEETDVADFGTNHTATIHSVAYDEGSSPDKFYIAGGFNGDMEFTSTDEINSSNTTDNDAFWARYQYNTTLSFDYGYELDHASNNDDVKITGVASYYDPNSLEDLTYVMGTFSGTIMLDGNTSVVSQGGTDAFIALYDQSGNVEEYYHYSGELDIQGGDIICHTDGSLYVTGRFKGSATQKATLGDGSAYESNGGFDGFVDKFDPSLTHDWSQSVVLESATEVKINDIDISTHGDYIYFTGYHFDDLEIASTSGSSTINKQNLSSSIAKSAFVACLKTSNGTNNGDYQVPTVNTTSVSNAYGVKLDFHRAIEDINFAEYELAVLVNFDGELDNFSGINSSTSTDVVVLIIDHASGALSQQDYFGFTGAGNEFGKDISFDNTRSYAEELDDDVIVAIGFENELEFNNGGTSVTLSESSSNGDLFIGRFSSGGTYDWHNQIDLDNENYNAHLAINGSDVSLFGKFNGSLTQGSTTLTSSVPNVFYCAYKYSNGSYVASSLTQLTSASDFNAPASFSDLGTEIYLGGKYESTLTLPGFGNLSAPANTSGNKGFSSKFDICGTPPAAYAGTTTFDICTSDPVDLNATIMGGGNFYWYEEEGSTGDPKFTPINTDFRSCFVQINTANKYWVAVADARGCISSKVQISFTAANGPYTMTAPTGSTLCGGGNGNTLQLSHTGSYPSYYKVWLQKLAGSAYGDYGSLCNPTPATACSFTISTTGNYRLRIDNGCSSTNYTSGTAVSSAFGIGVSSNITNPVMDCPDDNQDVTLSVPTGTGLTYQWIDENGPTTLTGENSNSLADVVATYGPGTYHCVITQTIGASTCILNSKSQEVLEHPDLELEVNHGSSPVTNFDLTDFDFTTNDAETRYGGRAAQTMNKQAWFYYQGREISHFHVTSPSGGPVPGIFPVDYDDVIADAVSENKMPSVGDYPGVYFVRTFPNCASSLRVNTNEVILTMDCSPSAIPAGATEISSDVTVNTTYTHTVTNRRVYISSAIDISATLSISDCEVIVSDDITISEGGKLDLTNCMVRMATGTEIIVQNGSSGPGGILEMDYVAKTTPTIQYAMNMIGCSLWKGVTVEGSPTSTYRGKVVINGSQNQPVDIGGAEIGIYSKAGGLLEIEYARFSNNHNDVAFGDYASTHNSFINNSIFTGVSLSKASNRVAIVPPGTSSPYRFQFDPSTYGQNDYGNMIYLEDVDGISFEDNSFAATSETIVSEILGGTATSEGIRAYNADNITIEGCSWTGHHLKGAHFEDSDNLILTDNIAGELIDNGFKFKNCNGVTLNNSAGSSIFDYEGSEGLNFESCDNIDIDNIEIDMDLDANESGIVFDDCSTVDIAGCEIGSSTTTLDLGIHAFGSSYTGLTISGNTFDKLKDGVLIEDGDNISITGSNVFKNIDHSSYNSIALQYYGTGTATISENTFTDNNFCIVVSPVDNPLTATSGTNLTAGTMDLSITCNKFAHSEYGIVGSGKFTAAIGNATTGAENWFGDIAMGGSQGLSQWDILWQAASLSGGGSVSYNFLGDACNLTYTPPLGPPSVTNAGYTPNNGGGGGSLVLNGTSISVNQMTLNDLCPGTGTYTASCYGSFKKGTGIEAEVEALDVQLFPNPTKGDLMIESNFGIDQVNVFDMNHRQIMTMDFDNPNTAQLKTSQLSEGVYFIHIHTQNQNVIRKLVKF